MKVLILGVGDPIPTFILRRLKALDSLGVQLLVVGNSSNKKYLNLNYGKFIQKPIPTIKNINLFLFLLFTALPQPLRFLKLSKCFKGMGFARMVYETLRHWSYIRYKKVDLIHLQWLSMVAEYSWLKSFYLAPIIASARGSQVTIYPVSRNGYREYIITCIKTADYIHCVSKDIQERCLELGALQEKTFINYNGIDTDKFKPSDLKNTICKDADVLHLITVGSLMWRKGVHYQLLILKELLRLGHSTHLTIVGNGPDQEGLQYQAKRLRIEDSITWKGKCSEGEIISLLQSSDVYLSTSAAEGLANVVVEAAACGLPVVTFECEGMSEVVESGKNGWIVPYGDISLMIDKISNLKCDVILRNSFAKNSREIIANKFREKEKTEEQIFRFEKILLQH